jgi:diguanylate cyclase (GGDEF)-like protein
VKRKKVLVVDDEKTMLRIMDARLSSAGYEVFTLSDPRRAVKRVKELTPDLVILDIVMPGIDGLAVKAKLGEDPSTAAIPVIFLTAKDATDDKVRGLAAGADDYISKPFNSKELLARIRAALKKREFYEEISMADGLTGLHNVHFFKKQFSLFFNISKRYKKIFSLAIIDIDNFKSINDTYGHAAGDFVLQKFSSIAKETLRKSDIIARYGGDEFAVIMPETGEKQALFGIERLKKNIAKKAFILPNLKKKINVSISAGIACYEENFTAESQVFELADKRLYESKRAVKNRV